MIKKNSTPVYCFNEHNQSFYYWHKARIEGHLNRALDLIHIDAHDDMARPPVFSESLYPKNQTQESQLEFYQRFASSQLTITDFILPAILSGVVKNVYFVYPKWRKYKPIRKRHSVSSAFGEGRVLKFGIKTERIKNPLVHKAYPDLTRFFYFTGEAKQLPRNRKVILDIDLDYFACRDSVTNQLSYELEITRDQFNKRDIFLGDKTLPFSGLQIEFYKRDKREFVRIKRKKIPELFHLPSEEEIEKEMESLVSDLMEKKIKPSLVTICRSCDSGYCPEKIARFIEPRLIEKLKPLIA